MRILPVLDLMNGLVVRGIAGRRSEYRPVASRLAGSAEPVAVANAFRTHFGLAELYLADLDAILGGEPALSLYRELQRRGFRLWVDAGIPDCERADALAAGGVGLVVGLETIAGPNALAEVFRHHGEQAVFSLDLHDGVPLGDRTAWGNAAAAEIARHAAAAGARRILVLDLARVGVAAGVGTEKICAGIRLSCPNVETWSGGGIRGPADLTRLEAAGIAAVLVASALHDDSITAADVARHSQVRSLP